MKTHTASTRPARQQGGFSLIELMVSMGITVAIVGSAVYVMDKEIKVNDNAILVATMSNSLRTGMDLLVIDMLQVGSGLPTGHVILTPSGTGAQQINIPGPPGTAFKNAVGDLDMSAVVPGPGKGPVINGVATDVITVLTADNNFTDMPLTAITNNTFTVSATNRDGSTINIASGPDRLVKGQVIMLEKGSTTCMIQITDLNTTTRVVTFTDHDSLNINQSGAAAGNVTKLRATAPTDTLPASPAFQAIPTSATRVRMITYYLDNQIPDHPRLVRRINNGDPTTFDNTSGTAVAIDIENLQFTFDLTDGVTNPSNVKFVAADYTTAGACAPNACSETQIRKINIALTGRSKGQFRQIGSNFRNTLTSQVSLRGMAFIDEYLSP